MSHQLRVLLALARAGLRTERRAGEALLVIAPFGSVALLLIAISAGADVPLLRRLGPGVFWVVLVLFGVLVGLRQSAVRTTAQTQAITLAGVPGAVQLFGGAAASVVLLLGFGALLSPVMVILYDPALLPWPWFLGALAGVSLGLALLTAVAEALVRRLELRSTLGPLLIVPLALPLLLGANQSVEAAASGLPALSWFLLVVTVDVVLFLAALFAGLLLEIS